jgi:hypothetical protein
LGGMAGQQHAMPSQSNGDGAGGPDEEAGDQSTGPQAAYTVYGVS